MGVLMLDIEYQDEEIHEPRIMLMFKAQLGYRNKGDPDDEWKPLADSFVHRNLDCDIDDDKKREGFFYNCSMLSLFELGSLHHDYYLLNIRIPSIFEVDGHAIDIQNKLGKLSDVLLVTVYQNGGFTKVWLSLKTIFFIIVLGEMIWFWNRVRMLPRNLTLLERMLFALGCALTLLNVPLEYLTLSYDMPWLTLFNDIKQVTMLYKIHEADPQSRPVVITIFTRCVCTVHSSQPFKISLKTISSDRYRRDCVSGRGDH